jgi:hypothetical protein
MTGYTGSAVGPAGAVRVNSWESWSRTQWIWHPGDLAPGGIWDRGFENQGEGEWPP